MDDSHAEVEIEPQLKPRGSVAKEEDLPTSCTSCRLNPHDQLCRLCLWNILKDIKDSHKGNTLVLIAVDKNTQE